MVASKAAEACCWGGGIRCGACAWLESVCSMYLFMHSSLFTAAESKEQPGTWQTSHEVSYMPMGVM